MSKKGFTLIEVLVVLAVLAILASISIPLYRGYQRSATRQEATSNLQALVICLEQSYAENSTYAGLQADGTPRLTPATYTWTLAAPTNTWLPCFDPRKGSGGAQIKFDYSVTVNTPTRFTATATGARGLVTGDVLTITQAGEKTGPWPN